MTSGFALLTKLLKLKIMRTDQSRENDRRRTVRKQAARQQRREEKEVKRDGRQAKIFELTSELHQYDRRFDADLTLQIQ